MHSLFRDTPIRRKLIVMFLVICALALVGQRGTILVYEFFQFRELTVRQLSMLGKITAANSTAALAFANADDATEILNALQAEPHIVAACLYDREGRLFAKYPEGLPANAFPAKPAEEGLHFARASLAGFQPVVERGNRRLGTLFLKLDTGTMMIEWLRGSLQVTAAVMSVIFLAAFAIAHPLRRQISRPILALAEAARAVSDHRDYSVRAPKFGDDELGRLTDAFNHMLAQIQRLNQDLEQRVIERTAQLEAANRELEAFSYSVSHDLRAPLRHIDGFANLLAKRAETVLDAQSGRYLTTISRSAKQMGRLIDDLLTFSRMGRTAMNRAKVDQNAMVAAIIREGNYEQDGRAIAWEISPLPEVRADAAMLRQVWCNLIENAVKYSGKNPNARIAIGSRPSDEAAGEQVFFVSDNGVGFDMAYASKLFGVFQRLHSPAEFEGTGIGLANVRRIVMRHGGRTWAESRVGEGAVFYFSLPIAVTAELSNASLSA